MLLGEKSAPAAPTAKKEDAYFFLKMNANSDYVKNNAYLCGMIVREPILRKCLTLMMLLLLCSLPRTLSAMPAQAESAVTHTLGQTQDDMPTWQDLGLEDLIVNANECPAPVSQSLSGHHAESNESRPGTLLARPRPHPVVLPARANDYYLYFLYRLRL